MTAAQEVVAALRGSFRGDLLQPGDAEFIHGKKVWNGMVQRTPGAILRCADVSDVQAAVKAAAALGISVAVRCGGHSLAGFSTCEEGVVIDLSRMQRLEVNESARRAWAQGGCLLGTIDAATQRAGLVFPSGVVSHTGASGLILGGGTGWLTRLLGLSCDNVAGYRVVLADGSLVHATPTENADLFWALRGGGGNFGIVTEFELKLHPLRSVLLCTLWRFDDDIAKSLRFWREYMPEAPHELKWNISLRLAPPITELPSELHGKPCASEAIVWCGEEAAGKRYFQHILSCGKPCVQAQSPVSYLSLQTMADDDFPSGARYYTKCGYFETLADATIEKMVDSLKTIPSPLSQVELAYLGGAAARTSARESAFGDRSAPFILNVLGHWNDSTADKINIEWVRSLFTGLRSRMKPGVYVNFMSGDEESRVQEAYSNWNRLLQIKETYDPRNFFRRNQNIARAAPAISAST